MSATPIHVLIIEDSENDMALLIRELRKGGFELFYERVDTPEAMSAALDLKKWDIILSDYSLPRFNGLEALKLLREKKIKTPFLIVSGSIGEETAVEVMKSGVQDYIMKDNLSRLVPSVKRALRERNLEQEQKKTEEALAKAQERFRSIYESCRDGITFIDFKGHILDANHSFLQMMGYSRDELLHLKYEEMTPIDYHRTDLEMIDKVIKTGTSVEYEKEHIRKDGSRVPVSITRFVVKDANGFSTGVASFVKDITERKKIEKDLKERQDYLERFHKLTVGRELEMVKLKNEVNELLEKLGRPKKY